MILKFDEVCRREFLIGSVYRGMTFHLFERDFYILFIFRKINSRSKERDIHVF